MLALTVYHDGRFWVGMLERVEDGQLSVCKLTFGAEPSNEDIQQLICERWYHLRFTRSLEVEKLPVSAANPKRRQREAAAVLRQHGPSTKAQQALAEEREAAVQQHKANARERREEEKRARFQQRQEKKEQKHRGR